MSILKNKIQNILISKKIIIFFGIIIIFISLLLFLSIRTINLTRQQIDKLNVFYYENELLLSNISNKINQLELNSHLLVQQKAGIIELQSHNQKETEEIKNLIEQYETYIYTIEQSILYENLLTKYQKYQNITTEIYILAKNSQDSLIFTSTFINKQTNSYNELKETLNKIKKQNNFEFKRSYKKIQKYNTKILIATILVSIFFIIILTIFSLLLAKSIRKQHLNLKKYLLELGKGSIPDKKIKESKTELGEIASLINILTNNIKRIESFVTQIESEKYDSEIELFGEKDKIGSSLLNIRKHIISSQQKQEQRSIDDERKNWATEGISKFSEIMRESSDNIQKLSDTIIKNIVSYLKAKVGGLFIYNEEDPDDIHLFLLSTFAYDRKKYFSRKVKLGDGLIGTAALDKTSIYITDIPQDYIEIESGLGNSTPRSLLIIPLKTDRGLLGVIEIASFTEFEEYERKFAEELADSIASTLETVKINARTIELLKESEKKSDDLQKNEQELRKTMEQVQFAQEESEKRAAEMSSILSAVDQALLKIEINTDKKIISANQRFLRTFGYIQDEIINKHFQEILPEEEKQQHNAIFDKLKSGQTHRATYKFINNEGKEIWLLSQFAPILDAQNVLIRILYLSIDISEQKVIEEKNNKLLDESVKKADELMKAHAVVKQNEIEITGIITAIDQTLMKAEYSVEGNLLSANEKHIVTMGYDFKATKGKNILSFIPKDELQEFKDTWFKVQQGEPKQITVKRKSQATGKDLWLLNQYTPIKDAKNKVLKILYMAIDITEQKEIEQKNTNLLEKSNKREKELIRTQTRMKENEINMKGIISAIDQTLMKAEYSVEGNLLSANEKHITTMGYDFKKTKGENIISFIPKYELREFRAVWKKVQNGNSEQITVKRKSQSTGKDIWLLNQYTPVKDEEGYIFKILYLAIDISEQKEIEERNKKLFKDAENKQAILINAQKKMRENELEMKGIISAIDQTLMKAEYSFEGILISANQRHIETMGYDFEKTKGKDIISFIPRNELFEFKIIWKKVQQGESQQVTVKRINKATKQEIWLLNQYTPLIDDNNNVYKVLYFAIDVTEQKNAEQKNLKLLRKSKDREENLLQTQEQMQMNERELDGIISAIDQTLMKAEYSVAGILISANEKHIETMGYDFEKTKGKNIISFIPEDELKEFKTTWEKVQQGDPQQITVKRINKATKQEIWLLNQYTPLISDKKNVYKILYFAIDVTEQKNAEQKNLELLEKAKEKEKDLLQTQEQMQLNKRELESIVFAVDQTLMKAEYSVNGILLSANNNHTEILGYNFADMKGSNILVFIPEKELKQFQEIWTEVQKGKSKQITVKRKNQTTGETLWLLNQYTPIKKEDDRVYKILYIAIDVTKQKLIENELTQQEKQMRLNMEELLKEQSKLEKQITEFQDKEKDTSKDFESGIDKKYNNWLSDF